jgi:hypothetical protein
MQKKTVKFFVSIFFFFSLCSYHEAIGQSDEAQSLKKFKWLAEDSQGFYNVTTFSFDFFNGPFVNGLQTINGYRLNPFIAIGGGIGLERYVNMDMYDTFTANLSLLPVFAEIRYTVLNRKVSPVIALQVGYKYLLNRSSTQITAWKVDIYPGYAWTTYNEYDYYTRGGLFFTIEGGVKAKVYKKLAVYLSASYSVGSVSGDHYLWAYEYLSAPGGEPKETTSREIHPAFAYAQMLLLRLGIAF